MNDNGYAGSDGWTRRIWARWAKWGTEWNKWFVSDGRMHIQIDAKQWNSIESAFWCVALRLRGCQSTFAPINQNLILFWRQRTVPLAQFTQPINAFVKCDVCDWYHGGDVKTEERIEKKQQRLTEHAIKQQTKCECENQNELKWERKCDERVNAIGLHNRFDYCLSHTHSPGLLLS